MNDYYNYFKRLSREELFTIYKQYLQYEKSGVINENYKELSDMRDKYCAFYAVNGLLIMERDLLSTIAYLWYLDYTMLIIDRNFNIDKNKGG